MSEILGTHKRKFIFHCTGTQPSRKMMNIAKEFIKRAGMNVARTGRVDFYPYQNKGGQGYTLYQPLFESYLVIDVYDDLNETEILLSTCKPERINLDVLTNFLRCQIGQIKEIETT